jgi:hypothetical protein
MTKCLVVAGVGMAVGLASGAARAEDKASAKNAVSCTAAEGGRLTTPTENRDPVRLVARLANPPRANVTLSIDDDYGAHFELVWAPTARDALQQELLLPAGTWTIAASVDDQLYQNGQIILNIATRFTSSISGKGLKLTAKERRTVSSLAGSPKPEESPTDATIEVYCRGATVAMEDLTLDPRRAAAASTARGLLDQAVPAPVGEALALLGEIAVARAKAGAMDLVRKKFVGPMCDELTLKQLRLGDATRAFPRACALLETMRLEDVLSSGRSLVEAAGDDLRLTIAPRLIDRLPGVGPRAKDLATIALDFANRIIEGEAQQIAEVDLLIALVDRVLIAEGLRPTETVLARVLAELQKAGVDLDPIKHRVVELALPADFDVDDDDRERPWQTVTDSKNDRVCKRTHPKPRTYVPADREACVDAIVAKLAHPTWLTDGQTWLGLATWRNNALAVGLGYLDVSKTKELVLDLKTELPRAARDAYCAGRVILSIAKWCSGRDRCSAGDIGKIVDRPWSVFKPTTDKTALDSICWENWRGSSDAEADKYFAPFGSTAKYTEMATTLVSFLSPVPAGQERARTVAMVRWLFAFVSILRTGSDEGATLTDLQEIVERLIDRDYMRALGQSIDLAERLVCPPGGSKDCEPPRALRKTAQLLGAVASYARTYDETKSLDPAEARKARKQALEALIDAATDRHGREGDAIWSLGSPVGISLGARWTAGDADSYQSEAAAFYEDTDFGFQWRVPLSLVWQRLPKQDECIVNNRWFRGTCGTHLALSVADLGQLARSGDDLRWSDFLGVGLQAGVLLGNAKHSVVVAAELTWAPGLYEREVKIETDAETETRTLSGAFTAGVALAYYVPFFDLN